MTWNEWRRLERLMLQCGAALAVLILVLVMIVGFYL